MFMYIDSFSPWLSPLWFILVLLLGNYLLLNFMLATIYLHYNRELVFLYYFRINI